VTKHTWRSTLFNYGLCKPELDAVEVEVRRYVESKCGHIVGIRADDLLDLVVRVIEENTPRKK
jgi:hypothetical protein